MDGLDENLLQPDSMPVHNPLYRVGPVCFRVNIARAELAVENPRMIARMVPHPLVYEGDKIIIVLMEVTELKEGFSEEETLWNEVGVQIEVTYNGNPWLYVCEVYSENVRNILSGREVFGYPKVPGRIAIEKSANRVRARLFKGGTYKEILTFTYTTFPPPASGDGPTPRGSGPKAAPKIILFKCIPSAIPGNRPEVQQLVTIRYGKPVIHDLKQAKGSVEILQDAPEYLKTVGIMKAAGISCLDMEMNVIGGEILHDYRLQGRLG